MKVQPLAVSIARDEGAVVADGVQEDVGQKHPRQARDDERPAHDRGDAVGRLRALREVRERPRIDVP